MSLKFFWRCDSDPLDGTDDFSAGDTTPTAQGTPSLDAGAANIGSTGILFTAGNTHYRFDTASIANRQTGALAFWFRIPTAPGAIAVLAMMRGISASDYVFIAVNGTVGSGTGELRFSSRSTDTGGGAEVTITTSGANLTTNTWYFCVIQWDDGADSRRVAVYDASGALIDETIDAGAWVAPLDLTLSTGIRIGEAAGVSMTGHIDNVFIGDAYADGDVFVTNRNITSYTSYSTGGGGGPTNIVVPGTPQLNRRHSGRH